MAQLTAHISACVCLWLTRLSPLMHLYCRRSCVTTPPVVAPPQVECCRLNNVLILTLHALRLKHFWWRCSSAALDEQKSCSQSRNIVLKELRERGSQSGKYHGKMRADLLFPRGWFQLEVSGFGVKLTKKQSKLSCDSVFECRTH